MKLHLTKAKNWLLHFLQLQLFITLVGLPMLLSWGLPISLLSPIGNLVFAPFLTVFLSLSSLLFFTEILCIPNSAIAWILQKSTNFWLYTMSYADNTWLIALAKPSFFVLVIIPLAAFAVLHFKYFKHVYQRVLCLALLLGILGLYIKFAYSKQNMIETYSCNRGHITIVSNQRSLIIIDPGVIGQRISAPSWVEYTLIAHLIKNYGINTIDTFIALQPSPMTFRAIATLASKIKVKKVYIPLWQGSLSKAGWGDYFTMRQTLQDAGTILERIASKNIEILLASPNLLTITPLETQLAHAQITFPAIFVKGKLQTDNLEIYPYKYAKQIKGEK